MPGNSRLWHCCYCRCMVKQIVDDETSTNETLAGFSDTAQSGGGNSDRGLIC